MKVLKFGGTSVGSAQRIKNVAKLINDNDTKIVVLSAMSGTTNTLVEIAKYLQKNNAEGANVTISALKHKYYTIIDELFTSEEFKQTATIQIKEIFQSLAHLTKEKFDGKITKLILSQGELISTALMTLHLQELGVNVQQIPALEFMKTTDNGEPDTTFIKENLEKILDSTPKADIYITQGFICRNEAAEVDNLERGGSDYSASLIGAAIQADEIQIWTDIDGMHNNDPRVVDNTTPVRELHFDEAAELAYFGAKILHPTCILPAQLNNIPVRLLNTMEPDAPGTLICNKMNRGLIKAVAAKDGITAIKIKSGRMLMAYGFLSRVFEIFEKYQTSIDMITTSEIGVSLTIEDTKYLSEILNDLTVFSTVTVDTGMVIICVVGDLDWYNVGFESKVVSALHDVPVRMISYGGSNHNISFLVSATDKQAALKALSKNLFN
ncbi:MAG: aspartate kinase [Rikenellaceae bacterium]